MYDEDLSWFGCCTGTQITDCYVQTACVPSSSLSQCLDDADCYMDPLATAWWVTFLFSLPISPSRFLGTFAFEFLDGG
jgi:hypothetical protein